MRRRPPRRARGCRCGPGTSVELVWGGPPQPGAGGVVPTDGFASFQEGVAEAWEHSPATAAAEFLRLDERKAARITVDAKTSGGEGTSALHEQRCRPGRGHTAFAPEPCV